MPVGKPGRFGAYSRLEIDRVKYTLAYTANKQ